MTSASLNVASETSTGYHKSEPTTRPNGNTNHFTFPDDSTILDINGHVDVRWVTDATDCSIQLNCTLDATKENFTSKGIKPQAISLRKCSSILRFVSNADSRCRSQVADWILSNSSEQLHLRRLRVPTAEQVCNMYLEYA